MKAIILAAGYGTRLYPLTLNIPKQLIDVNGRTILDYQIDKLYDLPVDEIILVTNEKFFENFKEWEKKTDCKLPIKILNDRTISADDRLGALGDLLFVIEKENINEDILVLNGDNLFTYSLTPLLKFFEAEKNVNVLHEVPTLGHAKLLGVAAIDKNNKITSFVEKPENPPSKLSSTGIYVYPKRTIALFKKFTKENKHLLDKPGFFVEWLVNNDEIYGHLPEGMWFDIGSFKVLEEAREFYKELK